MTKLAIDIILLPFEEMMERVIELNKELLKTNENKIILDKVKCVPHISLAMGCIDNKQLPEIEKTLQGIAKQFRTMKLRAVKIYTETISTGKKVAGFEIEKTKAIQTLHETAMERLKPYLSYNATLDTVFSPLQPEEVMLYWVNNFRTNSSFEKFFLI